MNYSGEVGNRIIFEPYLARAESLHGAGELAVSSEIELNTDSFMESFVPREYQTEVWSALDAARSSGKKEALVHLATGLGKTTVAVVDSLAFMKKSIDSNPKKMPKVMFVCHQNNILAQAEERFNLFTDNTLETGFFNGEIKDTEKPLTFATMQSLHANLVSIAPDSFDYIIYDEAHHTQADTFKEVVEHFKPSFQLALTATPDRYDGKEIRELFGEEVYSKSLAEALIEGHLADVEYHIMMDEAVKKIIQSGFSPKTIKEVADLLENTSRDEEIAKQINEEIHRLGLDNAKTIIFCNDIDQVEHMSKLLGGKPYHSKINIKKQQATLKQFRGNELNVIAARDMFNEGVDIPDARIVVFLRGTGSKTVFEQQLGRGLRKVEGKNVVTVLDFVGNLERLEILREFIERLEKIKPKNPKGPIDRSPDEPIKIAHGEFDFEKLTVDLLEKLDAIKDDLRNWLNYTHEDLINLAKNLNPEAPIRADEIRELSKSGNFPSITLIVNRFGSLRDFHKACGFDVVDWSDAENEDIIAIAKQLSPEKPLLQREIVALSKSGNFPSTATIDSRFGSLRDFHKACGFDVVERIKWSEKDNNEIIALAHRLSPDKPLTAAQIETNSKSGNFPSNTAIMNRFGSLRDFHKACGFDVVERIKWSEEDNNEIIALAHRLSPDKPLLHREIITLSQSGNFPSERFLKNRFGSIRDFRKACGFDVVERIKWSEKDNNEIIALAHRLSPDKPLTAAQIKTNSKSGNFPSIAAIMNRFGSIKEFHKACGFD